METNDPNNRDDLLPEREFAVPVAKKEDKREEIAILKITFSIPEREVNGLIQVFFNTTHLQIERLNVVAGVDQRYFSISPSLDWPEFERAIIGYICERGFNFRLSNELKNKIEAYLNLEDFENFQQLLIEHDLAGINEMLQDFISRQYVSSGFRLVVKMENITEEDFHTDRAPDQDTVLIDENSSTELDTNVAMGQGEVVIAPVMGVPIQELEAGDRIFVRVYQEQIFGYGSHKPPQQETTIRSITHDDVAGHTLIVETKEGQLVRILEREQIKVKYTHQKNRSYLSQVFSNLFNWYVLLFIIVFVLFYFIFLQ